MLYPNEFKSVRGWASTYGANGVTGGSGGETIIFDDSSTYNGGTGLEALRRWAIGNLETPAILIWTGGDVDLVPGSTFDFSNIKNKTILASSGQMVRFSRWRFFYVENVIVRNWSRRRSHDDLMQFQFSTGFWIDHNYFDGEVFTLDSPNALVVDGLLDITRGCDKFLVTNNEFRIIFKASLIGHVNPNDAEDLGKLNGTWQGNKWFHCYNRGPFLRYGLGDCRNEYHVGWAADDPERPNWPVHIHAMYFSQIVVDSCYFENSHSLWQIDSDGQLKYRNCIFDPAPRRPIIDNPGTWEPTDSYSQFLMLTATETKEFCNEWSGAKWHFIEGESPQTDHTLTLSKNITEGGAITRNPAEGDIEEGTSVTLTAPEIAGFNFQSWQRVNADNSLTFLSTNQVYTFSMPNSDIHYRAVYISSAPPPTGKKLKMRKPN